MIGASTRGSTVGIRWIAVLTILCAVGRDTFLSIVDRHDRGGRLDAADEFVMVQQRLLGLVNSHGPRPRSSKGDRAKHRAHESLPDLGRFMTSLSPDHAADPVNPTDPSAAKTSQQISDKLDCRSR